MIGELENELRSLLKGLDGQTAIFLGCFGVLTAQLAWILAKGPLPVPQAMPLFTGLGATFAAHSFFLSQRGLWVWISAVDQRLGPGSGRAILESALIKASLERGVIPGAGEFRASRAKGGFPSLMRRARSLSWLAPGILVAAAVIFWLQALAAPALGCAVGALLSGAEAWNLQAFLKTA